MCIHVVYICVCVCACVFNFVLYSTSTQYTKEINGSEPFQEDSAFLQKVVSKLE